MSFDVLLGTRSASKSQSVPVCVCIPWHLRWTMEGLDGMRALTRYVLAEKLRCCLQINNMSSLKPVPFSN